MLKKIFIKNYQNTQDVKVRNDYGKVAGAFGIFTNLLLGIIKLIIGGISKSVSIMADAVNNIADTLTSVITMIGFKLANKKPDKKHPYGYARYEYISGFVIAILMLIMGIFFAKESIGKIINPEELIINNVTYIVLIFAIIGKFIQMLVYLDFSKAINSQTLKANATDTKNDLISTIAILISMIIIKKFNINIDGFIGLCVSVFVIISSINMIKEVLEPIIGIIPTEEEIEKIKKKLLSYDVTKGVHDLVIHNYGVGNDFVTAHVEVDSKMNILECHDEIDNIEKDFRDELGIALTIHMDPIEIGNPKVEKLKFEVIKLIKEFDQKLQIHDFRIVEGQTHTNIIFDCIVPFEKNITEEELKKYLNGKITMDNKTYYYVIEIDRPFC